MQPQPEAEPDPTSRTKDFSHEHHPHRYRYPHRHLDRRLRLTPRSASPSSTWASPPCAASSSDFSGTLEIADDLSSAKAYGTVKAASVDTNEPQRDAHLRSPDFFDADTYPELTFESTNIEAVDEDTFRITGNLTLHGVTNEIVLSAEVHGTDVDPYGNEKVGLEITGQLSRGEFGMKFNQALGSGNMLVADKVKLALDISAAKQA